MDAHEIAVEVREIARVTKEQLGSEPFRPMIEWRRNDEIVAFAVVSGIDNIPEIAQETAALICADALTIVNEAYFTIRDSADSAPTTGELAERKFRGDADVHEVLAVLTFRATEPAPVMRCAVFDESVSDTGVVTVTWNDPASDWLDHLPYVDIKGITLPLAFAPDLFPTRLEPITDDARKATSDRFGEWTEAEMLNAGAVVV